MDPPTLKVSLLGGFELRQGTEPVAIESGRIRSLIAWLALHADGPQPRQRVAAALWPESPEGQARTNLRNLIHQLRRVFPDIDRYLETGGSLLEWLPGAPLWVDAAEFERAFSAARDRGGLSSSLEDALALYRGPLLPECYEPWIVDEQARVARLHLSGLEALLERYDEAEDFPNVRSISERILRHDPLSERAHRGRIAALAALGDRAGALRAYHECESLLAAELGVRPSRATQRVHQAALAAEPADEDPGGHHRARREWSLVGRDGERAALRRAWAATMDTGSRMFWVSGEPGVGKTRLVQSLAEWLHRHGHRAVQARAYPTLGALAYGPVVSWLRSPALADAVAAAPPAIRTELARLLPELVPPDTAAGLDDALTEAERRRRIHDAVIATLSIVGGPSTLVLDDMQWSDQETVDLVHALVLRATRPLLIVATVRSGEVGPDHPLTAVGTSLAAAGRLERIELGAFERSETGALARELADRAVTEDAIDELHGETEGNPLFIVEMVRSGRPWVRTEAPASRADSLSPRIRAVIEARLAPLSAEARTVTQVAAAMGREFSLPLLLSVAPLGETEALRGLDEAWRRRLVRERGDGSYDFSHDKIREVAYRTTSPIRRRLYHARVAAVLEDAWLAGAAAPEATLDQIALHHDRGGSPAQAVEWYRRAARAAAEVSALDAVRQLLTRALELLERLPGGPARDRQELEMRLTFGSVLVALEGYGRPRTVEMYERARDICVRLDRPVTAPILRALALAALAHGDLDAGSRFGRELVARAATDDDDVARVEGAYVSGVMAFWRGDLEAAERELTAAIAWYRPERHRDHVLLYAQDPRVVCLSRLAWTLWHRGRVAEAVAHRDEAIDRAERAGDPMGLAYTLWFTLFVAIEQGDIDRLDAQSHALRRIAAAHRLPYVETVADGFLGYLQSLRGEARQGIARMRATLADRRWHGGEYVLKLQTLYLLTRAAAGAGDTRTALAAVDESQAYLGTGPSIWKPSFAQLHARLNGADDRTGERALPSFRQALQSAREYGSAWTELGVVVDLGRWCLDRGAGDVAQVCRDLERALIPYTGGPRLPPVAAAEILLERLTPEVTQ